MPIAGLSRSTFFYHQHPKLDKNQALKERIREIKQREPNLDNAAMESFFGRMKVECFYGKTFESLDELENVIKEYVRYYNEERIQLKLKGLSPIQYRKQSLK